MSHDTLPLHTTEETPDDINAAERPDDERVLSPMAERIKAATNRVSTFLERRAVNKAHGEALNEDFSRKQDAQDEAYATYDNNIITDQGPDETDTPEKQHRGRKALRAIGNFALIQLEANGFIPLRGRDRGGMIGWLSKKRAAANASKAKRLEAGFLPPQPEEADTDAASTDTETGPSLKEQKKAKREKEFLEYVAGRKHAAAERKEKRKEKAPVRERIGALWQKAQMNRRKAGASAIHAYARTRASTSAARETWKESAQL